MNIYKYIYINIYIYIYICIYVFVCISDLVTRPLKQKLVESMEYTDAWFM